MKKNKKMIISIIFVLIFILTIFSGCVSRMETFPIATIQPDVSDQFHRVQLIAEVGTPFCKATNHMFVYDSVSHENWSNYAFKQNVNYIPPTDSMFYGYLGFSDLKSGVTYYLRAVAYCYDFKKPYENYTNGYYQGNEKTFKIS